MHALMYIVPLALTVSMFEANPIRNTVDSKHKTVKEVKTALFISIINTS